MENLIIGTAVVLFFAQGWYLNERLKLVHHKLDTVLECFNGLREYLYEIDPQFDEERSLMGELNDAVANDKMSFAGMDHMNLRRDKEKRGQRTLNTPFFNRRPERP